MKEEFREFFRDRFTQGATAIAVSFPIIFTLLVDIRDNKDLFILGLYFFLIGLIALNSTHALIAQKSVDSGIIKPNGERSTILVPKFPKLHSWARSSLFVAFLMLISIFFIPNFQRAFFSATTVTPTTLLPTINTQTPVVVVISPTSALPEITPSPTAIASFTDSSDHIDAFGVPMRLVPAGSFMMGSDSDIAFSECEQFEIECELEWFFNEAPIHEVYLDAYYIDKYEVTNRFYADCVDANVCNPPTQRWSFTRENYYGNSRFDYYPVIYVNWDMAEAYCEWRGARLPTEAQWEKAARGNDGRIFPWGNDIDNKYANFHENIRDTTLVSQYEKGISPYGVYDLAGNTLEWVYDWYSETYYQASPSTNPMGPNQGDERTVRGGSWFDKDQIRSAWRGGWEPFESRDGIGFRCATNVSP